MVAKFWMSVPGPVFDNVMIPVAKLLMVAPLPLEMTLALVGFDSVMVPELLTVPPLLSSVPEIANVPVDVISIVPVAKLNRV